MSKQHAVVLGGSSGIGLATARQLLPDGFDVTIVGRDADRLRHAADTLGTATAVTADAADSAALAAAFQEIGRFDHLVLALGSRRGAGSFASLDIDDVRLGFEEKVFPHFQAAQLALPHLNDGGSLTFVAALSAHVAAAGMSGIGAANAAIVALVPMLAVELKPLRVNGVSPGVIDTPWWDFLPEEQKRAGFAQYAAITPVGRTGTPDDVARTIAFLVENGFVTGQTILCDGGLALAA